MKTIEKAVQLMNDGNVEEAQDLIRQFLPNANDEEKFLIAELYYEWGFFEEAISLLEQLLINYPNEGQLITQLAEMYIELREDEQAIDILNEIETEDSFYLPSLLQLADLYQAQGLFEVSEQKLLEAKQLAPDEKIIDFALGELLFSIGQYSRAIPFYERVLSENDELNYISLKERLAECHALIGHYEISLRYYEEIDDKDPDTLFKYGFTAFQQNRNDIAINIWQQLIEMDPHYHTVYKELATAMKAEGLMEDAFNIVKEGLTYDEFNKDLFFLAGQIAISLNKRQEAIKYLEEAVTLDSDYQEAILLLIELYKDDHLYSDIVDLLNSVKKAGANDPIYDWELARAYREEEQYKKALNAFREANSHLTHDKDFLKEYGYFLTEEGLHKEAISSLEKYLSLEPLDDETASFVERLKFSIKE